jgi:hypothetical protein
MPCGGGGGLDPRRQILTRLGLLLGLSLLRWSEGGAVESDTAFFNKSVAASYSLSFICSEDEAPQAGRGGEGGLFFELQGVLLLLSWPALVVRRSRSAVY